SSLDSLADQAIKLSLKSLKSESGKKWQNLRQTRQHLRQSKVGSTRTMRMGPRCAQFGAILRGELVLKLAVIAGTALVAKDRMTLGVSWSAGERDRQPEDFWLSIRFTSRTS